MRVRYKVTSENDSNRVISEANEGGYRRWTAESTVYRQELLSHNIVIGGFFDYEI